MVTSEFSRKEAGSPVMLWVHKGLSDCTAPLLALRQYGEVLVVDSMEEGVEKLVHQPVDVLIIDLPVLNKTDPELFGEISRCWPYLLCLVVTEEQKSDSYLQATHNALTVLYLPEDSALLQQHLMTGLGQTEDRIHLH